MQEVGAPRGRTARRLLALIVACAVVAVVAGVIAFRNAAALSLTRSVVHGFGYDLAAGAFDVTLSRVDARDVHVRTRGGEPVLDAKSIAVGYSLRDLLPGATRLFGLESVVVDAPHLTLIHHADGSYNITLPPQSSRPAQPSPPPLNVRLDIRDGSAVLVDDFPTAPHERRVALVDIHAAGVISPARGSFYHAGAVYEEAGRRYPIRGDARFEDPRGFEMQHWRAAELPVAALANFALSTHAISVQAGRLQGLDVELGALRTPAGAMQSHLGMSGRVAGIRIAAAALTKPVRDIRGAFVVDDDAATVPAIDGELNGLPLHLRGALYHFAAPQIAFALTVRGDLNRMRALTAATRTLPLSGPVALQALVEGAAASPLIVARVNAPSAAYGAFRFTAGGGLSGGRLDVLQAAIRYGAIGVAGRASVQLAQHTRTTGYATLAAPADSVPYLTSLVPGLPLDAIAAVSGIDAKLAARGYVRGEHGSDRLDAPFDIDAVGSGTVGPVVLQRHDGASLYARAAIDRRTNRTVAFAAARAVSLLPAPAVALPGLTLPSVPSHLDAKLDADLTASATGSRLTAVGGVVHGYGSWGDVRADAAGSSGGVAARGRLESSFARLRPLTGNIDAQGGIDVPFALTNFGRSTVLQIAGARFPGARVRGIALQSADATLGLGALPTIDVYSARLGIAGRQVTAVGRFGNGGRLRLTAGDLDLAALRAAGVPVAGGRATVVAEIGGTPSKPTAKVVGALSGARYANADVGGDVGLAYAGGLLHIERATLGVGGAYAAATGTVAGLTLGRIAPRYDIRARIEDADLATLARTVRNPLRYPAGTLDADLHVGGAGAAPSLRGTLDVPEGSINGLSFKDGHVGLAGDANAIAARDGGVTVGSTTIALSGDVSRVRQSLDIRSERIDLADFDDYFDDADVLRGTGSAAVALRALPNAVNATADIALSGARYRRFELGGVDVHVHTAGTAVRLSAAVSGANGRANVSGRVDVPATQPLRDIVRRSNLDVRAAVAGIDLGTVLPAAGLSAPVFGRVDGSAVVRGRYPALALQAQAALTDGVVGRVPIDRFALAATAANGRGRLTDLSLAAGGLTANANGRFGLRPQDPFDLTLSASTSDINKLVSVATGKNPGIGGALVTHAHLTGNASTPQLSGTIDATNLAYSSVTIASVHADIGATRRSADVRNGAIILPRGGSIGFDGHAPLGSGAATPITFDFVPHHVDVNPYSKLLPDGAVIDGILDGNIGVRGTLDAPLLEGTLAFAYGSFRSNSFKNALTQITLGLDFSGTTVRIAKLHARAAPGNLDGTGTLTLRDLRDPIRGLTTDVNVQVANAYFALPKYYTGYIDGALTARKRAAAPLTVGGDLTFSSARIPYTALVPSGGSTSSAAPALPDVAFDLGVDVTRDVRIQSGPVDIGTTGSAKLGGTLAAPTLDGRFAATDGTVSLYRTFTVQNGSVVTFAPGDGVTPSVDATAVTNVPDPPTDVLLHVTGLADHLHLAFSSEPPYSQEQILGLLVNAQALGAVSGVASTGSSSTGGASIAGLGAGVLNTQLTQKFLQPLSSSLGGALGLSDLNLNYNLNGAVSATARRRIGKNVSFVYGEQIGGPTPRTSFGINVGTEVSGAQLTVYEAAGSQQAFGGQALTPFLNSGFLATAAPNYTLQAIEPPNGSGFVFSYQRRFW